MAHKFSPRTGEILENWGKISITNFPPDLGNFYLNKSFILGRGGGGRGVDSTWKVPLAPMGVLAPVSAHNWHTTQPPIDTSLNFHHMCLGSGWRKNNVINSGHYILPTTPKGSCAPHSGQQLVNYKGLGCCSSGEQGPPLACITFWIHV